MDILLPPWLGQARIRVRYLDNTGISRSPYNGAPRTATFGGDRLAASLEFTPKVGSATDVERPALVAFLARLRSRQNRAYLFDRSSRLRGSFPTSELLTNNTFASGTTGWTASGELTLTAADRVLRAVRSAVTGDQTIRAAVATVVSGATYAARVFAYAGRGAMDYRLRLGTSAGGSQISADGSDYTTGSMRTLVGVASGTSMHFSILDGISGSRAANHYMEFSYCSLSRCALVNGGSQTGSALTIDALPVSTNGLLEIGDAVEVITSRGSELKYLTSRLNSDSSGGGYLQFEPPLRGAPADNAPVIIYQPMGRFMFSGEFPEWLTEPGLISTASADFEEA